MPLASFGMPAVVAQATELVVIGGFALIVTALSLYIHLTRDPNVKWTWLQSLLAAFRTKRMTFPELPAQHAAAAGSRNRS